MVKHWLQRGNKVAEIDFSSPLLVWRFSFLETLGPRNLNKRNSSFCIRELNYRICQSIWNWKYNYGNQISNEHKIFRSVLNLRYNNERPRQRTRLFAITSNWIYLKNIGFVWDKLSLIFSNTNRIWFEYLIILKIFISVV